MVAERYGTAFPFGTLVVNVTGSFVVGLLAAMSAPEERWLLAPSAWVFLMVGVCGGYTTFSAFSLQTLALAQEGEWFRVAANSIASFTLGLAAVWLGYFSLTLLNRN